MNIAASHDHSLTPRAGRLAAELDAWDRRTITLAELWPLFARADPASSTRPTRRLDLAATIAALAEAGVVIPSKSLDRSAAPPLPIRLTLPAPTATASAAELARAVPWRPELAWAATAKLTVGQIGVLQTINGWLRDRGRDRDVLPLRERSLEVFGYEKRLDALIGTSLFGPGRLTLDLLRTFRAHPPLPVRHVGSGPILLVVENADTFDSLSRVLPGTATNVGFVGWGAGGAFEASVLSVGELPDVRDIAYFGDLDADGLRIPAAAATAAAAEGLPAVRPAYGLYRLLLDCGAVQPGQPPVEPQRASGIAKWLEQLALPARTLLVNGQRIPQEAVSTRVLMDAAATWAEDL
ncbi:hypothetical protein Drose_17040 [Dactylosporangium roseum]|uniref:Wadjet protein JetD C-terminal domain-containing protein n=1 Tax=Dactylosporangium roseum TaxID=47989 RepID=A0ABY5ZCB7_9ACTN|nr:DUF2220 domain-containing protein [Dactylosporangium roseum]UWZ39773.1 hypothetical protein Drose_17040 [Dactylosporangium roseum]